MKNIVGRAIEKIEFPIGASRNRNSFFWESSFVDIWFLINTFSLQWGHQRITLLRIHYIDRTAVQKCRYVFFSAVQYFGWRCLSGLECRHLVSLLLSLRCTDIRWQKKKWLKYRLPIKHVENKMPQLTRRNRRQRKMSEANNTRGSYNLLYLVISPTLYLRDLFN